jgi:YggT family protein
MILASGFGTQLAEYASTLIYVYILLMVLYIVVQLVFSLGVRPPGPGPTEALLGLLRDICEPFLRLFRRVIPALGGIDLSPLLAIIALEILNGVIVRGLLGG